MIQVMPAGLWVAQYYQMMYGHGALGPSVSSQGPIGGTNPAAGASITPHLASPVVPYQMGRSAGFMDEYGFGAPHTLYPGFHGTAHPFFMQGKAASGSATPHDTTPDTSSQLIRHGSLGD